MEPRPPRPRNPQPPFPGAAAPAGYPGAPPAGPAGYDAYPYAPAATPPVAPIAGELLPRQARRRQQAWRGVAVFVLALALIGGLGYAFRDTLLPRGPEPSPTAPAPALAASPAAPVATPTAAPAIANLLATATPTPEPVREAAAPTATPAPAAANGNTSDAPPANDLALVPLVDLLPATTDVPSGLTLVTTDERSESEVVTSLGGTDEDARLLSDWGWEGNAFNDFTGGTANGTYALNVSIHRFADDASADDALIYFSDKIVPAGYADAEIQPLGDGVRLLTGAPDGDPTSVIYMRDGAVLYRIGATAAADVGGDPTADVIAVAQALLAR